MRPLASELHEEVLLHRSFAHVLWPVAGFNANRLADRPEVGQLAEQTEQSRLDAVTREVNGFDIGWPVHWKQRAAEASTGEWISTAQLYPRSSELLDNRPAIEY